MALSGPKTVNVTVPVGTGDPAGDTVTVATSCAVPPSVTAGVALVAMDATGRVSTMRRTWPPAP